MVVMMMYVVVVMVMMVMLMTKTTMTILMMMHTATRQLFVCLFVSWCFEPSQPQRITSGLNTNFTYSVSKLFISQVIIPQVLFF